MHGISDKQFSPTDGPKRRWFVDTACLLACLLAASSTDGEDSKAAGCFDILFLIWKRMTKDKMRDLVPRPWTLFSGWGWVMGSRRAPQAAPVRRIERAKRMDLREQYPRS